MTIPAATIQTIFQDIGLFIRTADHLYGSHLPALIAAESVKKRTQLDSDAERLELLGQALQRDSQSIQMLESLASAEVQLVDQYVTGYVKDTILAKGNSAAEVLADLAEQMVENCSEPQYVLKNEVELDGPVVADPENAGDGTLGSVALSELIAAQRFIVECVDASLEGAEVWSVTGSAVGPLSTYATTGVAYEDPRTRLGFQITAGATAFAVGDKFYFYVSCTERRFQTFFRDRYGLVMPSASAGNETILEEWAE